MLEFLQNVITVNLGILFVLADLVGLAVLGELIIDKVQKVRSEGKSTTLEGNDWDHDYPENEIR